VRGVVDNNIWVSAILTRRGSPGRVLDAFVAGRFTLVSSDPLLAELAEVLQRPRIARQSQFTPAQVSELIASMRLVGEIFTVTGAVRICRDPKDDAVIETAIVGRADVLVSGDKDLTGDPTVVASLYEQEVRILSVAEFVRELDEPPPQGGSLVSASQGSA
jgi:uncharacterized protein